MIGDVFKDSPLLQELTEDILISSTLISKQQACTYLFQHKARICKRVEPYLQEWNTVATNE